MFQSPHGDSLFSDLLIADEAHHASGFNPLTGIRCFLTVGYTTSIEIDGFNVSIPSRGFVVF